MIPRHTPSHPSLAKMSSPSFQLILILPFLLEAFFLVSLPPFHSVLLAHDLFFTLYSSSFSFTFSLSLCISPLSLYLPPSALLNCKVCEGRTWGIRECQGRNPTPFPFQCSDHEASVSENDGRLTIPLDVSQVLPSSGPKGLE